MSTDGLDEGEREADAVHEDLIRVLEQGDTLPATIMLCGQTLWRLSKRTGAPVSLIASTVTPGAQVVAGNYSCVGKETLPLSFLDAEEFDKGFASQSDKELASQEKACVDLDWTLNRLGPNGILIFAIRMAVAISQRFDLTIDSVTAAAGELAARLERYAEEPEGAAELASIPSWSESFSDIFDACFGLAQAAEANGREGFVAYRDASPLLSTPSGFVFNKYVTHANLEGEYGPVSGVITAAFNTVGVCKRTEVSFRGNARDVVQMRAAACEALVREHGQPSHATEKVAEWALRMPNGTGHYTVELTPEYNEVQLTVTFRMKRFW